MGLGKAWTQEEINYLSDKWGTISIKTIAQNLGRTESAVINKKIRLKLGAFLESGEYVTWNQLLKAVGCSGGNDYKNISWIENRGFPIKTKRVSNNSFKVVYLEEFWDWAEKNRNFIDFSKMEENILGLEPTWVKQQRKLDYERNQKIKTIPWTKAEDEKLKRLLKEFKYSYIELSKILSRSNGAIQRRILDLKLKERPIKADNLINWTDDEFATLTELIKKGLSYSLIAEIIGKSEKAIRGRVYQMYLTENIDKIRAYIGNGSWGDGRPERIIKQKLQMSVNERQEVKENLSLLAGLIRGYAKQHYDYNDYWQKDICKNWDCYCKANETDCDSCTSFERIKPQYCVVCGHTFYEKVVNKKCSKCREQRKKQFQKKYLALNREVICENNNSSIQMQS